MMQGNEPQWDPSSVNHVAPWEVRLLILYLLLACIYLLIRVAQMSWFLWRSRHDASLNSQRDETATVESSYWRDLTLSSIRTTSLRRGALLTLLFSFLALVMETAEILRSAATEKQFGPAFLAGSFAEAMMAFATGLIVCTAFYVAFALLDGKLARRKMLPGTPPTTLVRQESD